MAVAREDLLDALVQVLREQGSLFDWAATRGGARPLAGRGTAWAVTPPQGAVNGPRWVVRHYRRGGAARWLDDRYLRLGHFRPLAELEASALARSRGVRTPEVVALAVYPAALFYRADMATVEIAGAADLAEALWAEHAEVADPGARQAALAAAGTLLGELADAGVAHPDLNAKNILLGGDTVKTAYVLDLDGCRVGAPLGRRARDAARARLERSLRKWERRTGRALAASEWAVLERSAHG